MSSSQGWEDEVLSLRGIEVGLENQVCLARPSSRHEQLLGPFSWGGSPGGELSAISFSGSLLPHVLPVSKRSLLFVVE